jgi:3-oxoadipate enol-lactonase
MHNKQGAWLSTPALRTSGFEDSLSAVAQPLCRHPLHVGLARERALQEGVGEGGRTTTTTKFLHIDANDQLPDRQHEESFDGSQLMKQKTVINGRRIAYALLGPESAPVVVLAHSLGASAEMWGYQLPLLTSKFRILVYDLPGHGDSDPPVRQDSFDDLATDLAALLDHAEIKRIALVGLSIGGMIAQHFAFLYPDRLYALVLCSTGCQLNETGKKVFEDRIAEVNQRGIETQVDASMARWFTPEFAGAAPATIDWVRRLYRKTSPAGFINSCRAIQELNTLDRLSGITVPTLVVPGEFDSAFPENVSRTIQSRIKNAQIKVLTGAAHVGNIERAHEFNEILIKFLAEVLP